jgi:hypothetical protein
VNNKIYLGDSVYAEFVDGKIKLTTENGYSDDPRNIIYLEPEVFDSLLKWAEQSGLT